MTDVVSKQTRSRMMAGIKTKNTKPEILVRKYLFSKGFRYRIHDNRLPGKPDLYLPQYKTVIFVHGCFWHGHECRYFKWPKTNAAFWKNKIRGNIRRDKKIFLQLRLRNLKVITIWECQLKTDFENTCEAVARYIRQPDCVDD